MDADVDVGALVAAAARGEQQAWNALVDRYLPLVRSVLRAYRLAEGDAEDVSQTVWLRLVEHLDGIREPRALPKWLMTTTKHEALRLIRSGARELPVDPQTDPAIGATDHVDVAADLLRAERHQALRDGLAELPASDRQLLLLLAADPPVGYREISRITGMPVGSIGPTRSRCLARLRATAAMGTFLRADLTAEDMGGDRNDLDRVVRQR
jgi:RNA polymerase sigma factor (sigma-70 family)